MDQIAFAPPVDDAALHELRREVRAFLAETIGDHAPGQRIRSWMGNDAAFSRACGEAGYLGMTFPTRYGGQGRTSMERYVVTEEMLAAGAPVGLHWIADRQSGPLLLQYGTEEQRREILPRVAAGECYFCIGMSEPDSGSDLAAARTRAEPLDGGFVINGTKVWTTNAHLAHYMILFCKTEAAEDRHGGASQLLIDLSTPGITISPILNMAGKHEFNEVSFRDVFVPETALIGTRGGGWAQVMGELAFERSGPERFLSTFAVLVELIRHASAEPTREAKIAVGRLTAHLVTMRRMSRSVAGLLQAGENPSLQATIVKDLGAVFEQDLPEIARLLVPRPVGRAGQSDYEAVLDYAILHAPSFSLRGGTREILRGIIARGLGLR
ncbi:acyl-CoA dehydrogenase family protein [Acuticoccus sediminis]|uniref:acyl-CoA dehydrogenase family protein n=1 Tax=Acuticoccus sediminis TaxID=2184697 RepID=UPI001CFE9F43|nr:acyl-CoA dehydrogenase family protein [Acuticoccus sediminis]